MPRQVQRTVENRVRVIFFFFGFITVAYFFLGRRLSESRSTLVTRACPLEAFRLLCTDCRLSFRCL